MKNSHKKIILVLGIVVILVAAVVFFLSFKKEPPQATVVVPVPIVSSSTAPVVQPASCQSTVAAEAQAKAGTIATDTILVSFASTTSFDQAEGILANLNASITPSVSESDYLVDRLIQATVPDGTEITALCTLEGDSAVKHAGFDPLFFLHP